MELLDVESPPERVLVVVAHPDDIDFGVAGTAAVLSAAGSEVVYALCTSGEAGIPEEMDRDELKQLREREQRAAALAVGVSDVRFLGQPDGHLQADIGLRRTISRVVRDVRPNVVISQSPVRDYGSLFASHPDHLACGEATVSAVYPDSRNPHAHPELLREGYEPHTVDELWVMRTEPNLAVDIGPVLDAKVAALSSHESQVGWIEDIDQMLRGWASETAERHGVSDLAEHVEVYRRVKTV